MKPIETGVAMHVDEEALLALRRLTDEVALLACTFDDKGACIELNPQARAYLASPLHFSWAGWHRFTHPDDQAAVAAVESHAMPAREDFELQYRIVRSDGSLRWMRALGTARYDAQGRFTGYTYTVREVPAQPDGQARPARSEAGYRLLTEKCEREEHYRSLVQLSADGYWETDAQGRLTAVEGSAAWQWAEAGPLLGKTWQEIAAHPGNPGLLAYLDKFARRESFRDLVWAYARPGNSGPAYASLSGEPMHRDGVFVGYRGLARDVTEQYRTQQRLQALSDQNRDLVEQSLDLICIFDASGRVLRLNPAGCRMTGYSADEIHGRHWMELLHPEDRSHAFALQQATLGRGLDELRDVEARWLTKSGEVLHLSWSAKWIRGERVLYATARDITEQRRAKRALEQAHERLNSVLESISDAFLSYDQDLRITYCNRAILEWMKRPIEEVLGRSLLEVEPGLRGTIFERRYREVLLTRKAVQFEAFFAPYDTWFWVRVYPSSDGGVSAFFHDISERKAAEEAEAALARSEARFAWLLESTHEAYFLATAELRFAEVNPALCRMTGFAKEELIGQPLSLLFPSSPLRGAILPRDRSVQTSFELDDVVIHHRNGSTVHVLMSGTIERDEHGVPISLSCFLNDITDRKLAELRLEQLATRDTLTDLPNRTLLNERMEAMLAAAARSDESLAVMFIDLDRFKQVNDSMGHEAGDELLRMVAQRLQHELRSSDFVARLGGDEFVVVLPSVMGALSASVVAEKLIEQLALPFTMKGQEVFAGASIGISLYPDDGETKEALFQNADLAMYQAKAAGRNGYRFFQPEMREAARRRLTLESALRRALEREEFEVHYQPRLDVVTLEVTGMEALLRWEHPQLGRVSPAQFIPLAEETGLIGPISDWVLQQACRQNQAWVEEFGRPLVVSVNLSPRQLQDRLLVPKVRQALDAAGMAANLLELELTESSLMQDPDSAAKMLWDLKSLGLSLAVDDFGTGYSSLVYLRRFPLDVLKLDRAFLTELSEEAGRGELAQAIIHLAHTMKLRVVAEGVETAEVFAFLTTAGCDEAQGYHLCRPLPPLECTRFLHARSVRPPRSR